MIPDMRSATEVYESGALTVGASPKVELLVKLE